MAVWSGSKKWRLEGVRKHSLWHLEFKGLVINWVASQASDKSPKNGSSLLGRLRVLVCPLSVVGTTLVLSCSEETAGFPSMDSGWISCC